MTREVDQLICVLAVAHGRRIVEICDLVGVSHSTGKRYLQNLRELGAVIEYDPDQNRYYVRDGGVFDLVKVRDRVSIEGEA